MKIAFFGTPEYVVPIFEYLLKNENVICAVTRSDKPARRHLHPVLSPIKEVAIEKKISTLSPEKLKDKDFPSKLTPLNPQLAVVAAYGKILPKEVLDIFPYGCVNLHFSILPKYRGAAPIQWAIIKGEKETGVSGFFMDEGLDTGKIIFQKKIKIDENEDSLSLQKKLIFVAIDVLSETLEKIKEGFKGEAQMGEVSYAPPLKKSDGKIDWNRPAGEIHNLIRGTKPWPSAYTEVGIACGKSEVGSIRILETEVASFTCPTVLSSLPVGYIVSIQKNVGFIVKCNPGFLLIKTVQPSSKNVMSAWSFLLGYKLAIADKLS
ncbi:MAG: methionyl-tRNA formyltransferase [Elusimicrobiota bacterium]|nr:methionyl-tRNA formyltransferase [Elusimicrobiota bacterium]